MTLIPLSRLLIEGRADSHSVALRHGEVITFNRFRKDVASAAAKFKNCRTAGLICQDSYNFAVGLFGLLHAGAKIILPPNGQPGSLQLLQDECDSLIDDTALENINSEAANLKSIDPEQLSLVFYTSGSTGAPKKILKNLTMLENEIATLDALWGKSSGQGPVFATVSHQHIYGLTFKLLWPLSAGRPFATETHILWENFLAVLAPNCVLVSSPAHLSRMDGIEPLPVQKHLKRIFSAGAPLSLEASGQAKTILGCRPTEIFGSTETGAFATRCQIDGNEPWKLLPGIAMRSDDEGRLRLCSPFIGPEWLATPDVIEQQGDGFHFRGRADHIVKIEGKRISLPAIEQALTALSSVQSAAVVVLPGETNHLVAAIVPSEEGWAIHAKSGAFRFGRFIRNELLSTQEAAGIPRQWRFVHELPAQEMGKRRDVDIRKLFEETQMKLPAVLSVDMAKPDEAILDLEIDAGLEAFRGHFPDSPILPGVVQIDWAIRFATFHFGINEVAGRDFQVKFRNIIRPDTALALMLQLDRTRNRLSFTYKSDETIMSSGHIKLGSGQ